jgi:hypothetical protein
MNVNRAVRAYLADIGRRAEAKKSRRRLEPATAR